MAKISLRNKTSQSASKKFFDPKNEISDFNRNLATASNIHQRDYCEILKVEQLFTAMPISFIHKYLYYINKFLLKNHCFTRKLKFKESIHITSCIGGSVP